MDRWNRGGFGIWLGSYVDIFFSDEANAKVREFLHERIREKVHDPETAEHADPQGLSVRLSSASRSTPATSRRSTCRTCTWST